MKNYNNFILTALMAISAIGASAAFALALLFGLAGVAAVTQVSFLQAGLLLSFCIVFVIMGDGFFSVAEIFYIKLRRIA